jgi:dolichol-phosphate mannosyltransferase
MRCAPDDIIVRVEGDDTHEPEYVFSLLKKLEEGYDVVNTSRFQPGGGQKGVDAYRAAISRAANSFMHFVFGIPGVRDYSCGYRAYRASVIQDAIRIFGNNFIQLRGMGFTSTLEMIVKLRLLGCRFAEVPFVLRYDQKQSSSKMVSSITTLGYLTMALLYHWPFGGWRSQYRGLSTLYHSDHDQAIEKFGRHNLRLGLTSRISL